MGIEKADAGRIILDGEDISGYDIDHRAKAGIGFAFQQPPRFKGMTVDRLLSLAAGEPLPEQVACRMLSVGGTVREGVFKDERSTGLCQEAR